jgi:hypothetical protein
LARIPVAMTGDGFVRRWIGQSLCDVLEASSGGLR